jgi:dipeptidyl aminopeptidase/acylaminoacyl peptidase
MQMQMTRRAGVLLVLTGLVLWSPIVAQQATLVPNENLIAEGIPPIPGSLVDEVRKYSEVRTASLVDWHPLKREILISTRFGDAPQLHAVAMPAGARRQLTFFPDRINGGWYQPTKGDYLVFSKDIGGNEFYQLFRLDLATGDVTMLTDGKSRNDTVVWNRAGDKVAYTSTRRTGADTDVYVMEPVNPKSDRLLLRVEGGGWAPLDWSPDGTQMVLMEYISINESYVWLLNAGSGERTLLTPKGGTEKVSYGDARFSGDGKGLYLTTDLGSEFQQLAYRDLSAAQIKPLTAHIPWDVESFELSHDGSTIAFVTNEGGISKLHLLDTRSGKEKPAPALPVGLIGGLVWHRNDRDLGLTMTSARAPADAFSIDVATGQITRWTQSETGGLNTSALAEPELVRWPSTEGAQISGFLYRPPQRFTGKRPVIINIHGGPESQSRPGFIGRSNYFLNELGVAIIFPNVRGSSGFGKTFLKADNGTNRHRSYQDIGALLDWIKSRPDLDADRVLVTGGSYGGHMTLVAATQYNDRIRASIAVAAISSLVSNLEHTESYRRDLRRAEYGDERDPKVRQYMSELSPMALVQNISKPMFVIHGENDPRVPVSEARQIVDAARANKAPVWMLLGKNEGHGFARKSNLDYQFYSTIQFVRQHLVAGKQPLAGGNR